jgi:hypothetical protein
MKVSLRVFPPDEQIRYNGKRPVAVQFRCQFCGAIARQNYSDIMWQFCDDCRRSELPEFFRFDLLPHSRLINQRDNIR